MIAPARVRAQPLFPGATTMRFSGHETFALRSTWIPKAYAYLVHHPDGAFQHEEDVMMALGLGKNMVRALRFWLEAFDLATSTGKGLTATPFAHALLSTDGLDPFLERRDTLWLLHARIAMRPIDPICAWDVLINRWNRGEFTKSEAVKAFRRESEAIAPKPHSEVTLAQHFDVFVRTYVSSHAGGNPEENLDSPLVELGLVEAHGQRRNGEGGRNETVYRFNSHPKPDVSDTLFEFVLNQAFSTHQRAERSRSFRDLLHGPYGPGRIFRLPEDELLTRLERLVATSREYTLQLSAVQMVLQRGTAAADEGEHERQVREADLLRRVYAQAPA